MIRLAKIRFLRACDFGVAAAHDRDRPEVIRPTGMAPLPRRRRNRRHADLPRRRRPTVLPIPINPTSITAFSSYIDDAGPFDVESVVTLAICA
ncbi:MAG: hypothetical protein ACXWC5_30935 [Burkholderiales bacterium]